MSLIIEDGTGVIGADSYATVAEARDYASKRGVTLSATDADVEVLLRKACDYIESLESRFSGSRVLTTQALAWPRKCVYVYGSTTALPSDEIPDVVKRAQCQLSIDVQTTDLQPTGSGQEIVREKTDVLETEYAKSGTGSIIPQPNKALAILSPVIRNSFAVKTVRV